MKNQRERYLKKRSNKKKKETMNKIELQAKKVLELDMKMEFKKKDLTSTNKSHILNLSNKMEKRLKIVSFYKELI
jgi:hypothetical protein